jgi:hypothetical protein
MATLCLSIYQSIQVFNAFLENKEEVLANGHPFAD